MAGFGFGFGSVSGARRPLSPNVPPSFPTLAPSEDWNGTAASGFPVLPVDPPRTTAKPALRMVVPPNQAFTDELLVGVVGGANDAGTLMNDMGLAEVTFHFEGGETTVAKPTWQTPPTPAAEIGGSAAPVRPVFGWWAKLKHDGRNGVGHLYVTATARDPSMQRRVIGPYTFLPAAARHDLSLEIAPSQPDIAGQRYGNIATALNFVRAGNYQHARLLFTEGGTYAIPGATVYVPQGRTTIEASVPVTFALTEQTSGSMRPRHPLCVRGANITFDTRWMTKGHFDETLDPWLDGVRFVNSGGRGQLYNKRNSTYQGTVSWGAWLTECSFDEVYEPCRNASLVRGCELTAIAGDALSGALCVIGNTLSDTDSSDLRAHRDALTIAYTGSGTATVSLSGSNGKNNRVMTVKTDGSTLGSFTITNTNLAGNYDVADVVAWLNGLPQITATLLDDTRFAASLGLQEGFGASFGDTSIGGAGLTLATSLDIHSDVYAIGTSAENVIVANNKAHGIVANQSLWINNANNIANDLLFINNAFQGDQSKDSQLAGPISHVVIAHCSLASQRLLARYDYASPLQVLDAYSLIACTTAPSIEDTGTPDPRLTIRDCHVQTGSGPGLASGTSTGGSETDLFADASSGDFAAAGALLQNLKPSAVPFDVRSVRRSSSAPAGAVA